jgi:HEAT repeat protein
MTGRIIACGLGLILAVGPLALAAPKQEHVPPLIEKLKKHKDPKERAEAARQLGYIGSVKSAFTKSAVPALVDALKDADGGVRREAAITLGEIKADPKLVVQPLTDALKENKDNGIRAAIAETLSYFGPAAKVALPALEEVQKEMNALTEQQKQQNGQLIQAVNQAIQSIRQK